MEFVYGGTGGHLTMEDLIEEIVGNIYDEFDEQPSPEIIPQGDNLWRISGQASLEDVAEVLGKICVAAPEDYIIEKYPDLTDEQLNDTELRSVLYAGIFSGYEDSTLRLSGTFTRAEAAAVFTRLMKHIDGN